jgi:hypothetical protein
VVVSVAVSFSVAVSVVLKVDVARIVAEMMTAATTIEAARFV